MAKAAFKKERDYFTSTLEEEETKKMLHLKHSFIRYWNLDDSCSRTEKPGKFWNVVTISNIKRFRVNESKHNTLLRCKVSQGRRHVSALYYKAIIRSAEGWRRSVEPMMWEMKKCYLESISRGISYMKNVNGRLTGWVIFWVETASYSGLLKER